MNDTPTYNIQNCIYFINYASVCKVRVPLDYCIKIDSCYLVDKAENRKAISIKTSHYDMTCNINVKGRAVQKCDNDKQFVLSNLKSWELRL